MAKSNRNGKKPAKRKPYRPPTPPKIKNPHEVIQKLAAEQGVDLENQWENIVNAPKRVFRSQEEMERFIETIYAERRRGRGK